MNQFWIIVLYFLVYQSDVYLGSPYFGYQVSLRDLSNKHFCSGAFINDRFILTTACCAHARSPNFITAIKKADMEDNTYEILIEKIISHEHFNLITKHGNIALLKTKQKVFFPFYDEPMFIEKSFESNYNLGFYLYGTESSKESEHDIYPVSELSSKYKTIDVKECSFDAFMINCTFYQTKTFKSDFDAGSPLAFVTSNNIAGILSQHGGNIYADLDSNYPRVESVIFTRTSGYFDWIQKHVKKTDSSKNWMATYGVILFAAFILIGCLALMCVSCSFRTRSQQAEPRVASQLPATMVTTPSPITAVSSSVFSFREPISTNPESPIIPSTPPPPRYDSLFPDKVISDD